MGTQKFQIGQEVVRSNGDYVVGRIGTIEAIDDIKRRVQVKWNGHTKTWVSFDSLEPTSIPYDIIPPPYDKSGRRTGWAKYIRKPENKTETHKVVYNGKQVDAINFGSIQNPIEEK